MRCIGGYFYEVFYRAFYRVFCRALYKVFHRALHWIYMSGILEGLV